MAKKLTAEEKIAKTIEYCKYSKEKALDNWCVVRFQVEIENTDGETETEQQAAGSEYTESTADISFLHILICDSVLKAYHNSRAFNNLSSVRVWIKKYKYGFLVDKEAINDYEITFKGGR